MASPQPLPQSLLTWLHSQLYLYTYKEQVFNNVCALLSTYSSLRPRTQVYTYPDGQSELLLSIYGTLPLSFRNQRYNIPIEIYIPTNFPQSPPMIYVIAQSQAGIAVRPGNHVDANGRCYHPYLSYWSDPNQNSSLLEVCCILSSVFSKDPPLYSRQQQQLQSPPPLPPKPISRPASASFAQPPPPPPVTQPVPQHKPIIADILDESAMPEPQQTSSSPEKAQLLDEIALELGKRAAKSESNAQSSFHQSQQVSDNLQRIQLALIRDQQELQLIQDKCIGNKPILIDKTEKAIQVTKQASMDKPPDIDKIICAENVVFNQLYQLVAQDRSIDDTIYILANGLNKECISLDVFIKHTRNLARDQFINRALVVKIAQDIGL